MIITERHTELDSVRYASILVDTCAQRCIGTVSPSQFGAIRVKRMDVSRSHSQLQVSQSQSQLWTDKHADEPM